MPIKQSIQRDSIKIDRPDDEISRNIVLVVGSNYPANIVGLRDFCEHAWPLVCKENPAAELWVAGKIGDAVSKKVPQARVLGWVENLQALYRQSAVVINPTLTGTGLKIKTIEALCNGKPLVATPNAVEGVVFDGEAPFLVCDNWPEFAGSIVSPAQERCPPGGPSGVRTTLRTGAVRRQQGLWRTGGYPPESGGMSLSFPRGITSNSGRLGQCQ